MPVLTPFEIYLVNIMNAVVVAEAIGGICFAVYALLLIFINMDAKSGITALLVSFAFGVLFVLTPTSKHLASMYVIPQLVKSCEVKVPAELRDKIDAWFEDNVPNVPTAGSSVNANGSCSSAQCGLR